MAYYLKGSVKDVQSQPLTRIVRAYKKTTGDLLGSTTSANDGTWSIQTPNGDSCFAICESATASENSLIMDWLTPVFISASASVKLLLNMSPTGVLSDVSDTPVTVVPNTPPVVAQGPFSPPAFSSTGVRIPANSGVTVTSGDFTIEGWLYSAGSTSNSEIILCKSVGTGYYQFLIYQVGSYIVARGFSDQNTSAFVLGSQTIQHNTWLHYAVTREGNTVRLFIHGAQNAATTFTGNLRAADEPIGVGSYEDFTYPLNSASRLFQPRITQGVARYTGPYTVPSAPFEG